MTIVDKNAWRLPMKDFLSKYDGKLWSELNYRAKAQIQRKIEKHIKAGQDISLKKVQNMLNSLQYAAQVNANRRHEFQSQHSNISASSHTTRYSTQQSSVSLDNIQDNEEFKGADVERVEQQKKQKPTVSKGLKPPNEIQSNKRRPPIPISYIGTVPVYDSNDVSRLNSFDVMEDNYKKNHGENMLFPRGNEEDYATPKEANEANAQALLLQADCCIQLYAESPVHLDTFDENGWLITGKWRYIDEFASSQNMDPLILLLYLAWLKHRTGTNLPPLLSNADFNAPDHFTLREWNKLVDAGYPPLVLGTSCPLHAFLRLDSLRAQCLFLEGIHKTYPVACFEGHYAYYYQAVYRDLTNTVIPFASLINGGITRLAERNELALRSQETQAFFEEDKRRERVQEAADLSALEAYQAEQHQQHQRNLHQQNLAIRYREQRLQLFTEAVQTAVIENLSRRRIVAPSDNEGSTIIAAHDYLFGATEDSSAFEISQGQVDFALIRESDADGDEEYEEERD